MDALVQMECIPQMFQNKYVILVSAAAQVESVRVLTYGFIGGPESGDRPDMKHTPFMLRLLTENLLGQEGKPDCWAADCYELCCIAYTRRGCEQ